VTLPTLDAVVSLAASLATIPDRRPDWLRGLHEATAASSLYYRLFYELTSFYGPLDVIEIGTYVGTSIAHLAAGGGRAVTVDHNPDAARQVAAHVRPHLANVEAFTADSGEFARLNPAGLNILGIDILFIDGNHTWAQAYGEYIAYRPFLRHGGLIFFDDIHLPMATREMDVFFDMIPDPRRDLPGMHHTGLGVAKVDHTIVPPSWDAATVIAQSRMVRA
jgi:predicted O-methyltransferase YrrM